MTLPTHLCKLLSQLCYATVFACVAAAWIPNTGVAQAVSSDSGAHRSINGFGPVEWSADSASVVRALGTPDTIRTIDTMNSRALVYAEHRIGRTTGSLGFLVHREHGLVRVLYLSEYGDGESCFAMYQNLRDTVTKMIRDAARNEQMYNHAENLPFCAAFQVGQAGAFTVWDEIQTRARAWLALDLGAGVVRLSLESPQFNSLADADPEDANE